MASEFFLIFICLLLDEGSITINFLDPPCLFEDAGTALRPRSSRFSSGLIGCWIFLDLPSILLRKDRLAAQVPSIFIVRIMTSRATYATATPSPGKQSRTRAERHGEIRRAKDQSARELAVAKADLSCAQQRHQELEAEVFSLGHELACARAADIQNLERSVALVLQLHSLVVSPARVDAQQQTSPLSTLPSPDVNLNSPSGSPRSPNFSVPGSAGWESSCPTPTPLTGSDALFSDGDSISPAGYGSPLEGR